MVESLCVVLPTYNEEQSIGAAVEVLQRIAERWQVIVVDDGSGDATAERVEPLMTEHPGSVRLIRHRRNLGYGAARGRGG
jgi:glycosyltransferase involved in cell wall biosynthesis